MIRLWIEGNDIEFAFITAIWSSPDEDISAYKITAVFVPLSDDLLKMVHSVLQVIIPNVHKKSRPRGKPRSGFQFHS